MRKTCFVLLAVSVVTVGILTSGILNRASENKEIAIVETASFAYCCIHNKGPFTEIEKIINQLMPTMQSQNIFPMGPMIGVYYSDPSKVPAEELEWEIGFPVTAQAMPQPPLEKKVWEFKLVASTIHTGPYETTGESYSKIYEWMEVNGYVQTGPVLERYLTIPTPETKPEDMKTEIWVPCEKKM